MDTEIQIKTEEEDPRSIRYSLFAGTKPGLLKGIQPTTSKVLIRSFTLIDHVKKENEITALSWANMEKNEVLVGHADKSVSLFDCLSNECVLRTPVTYGKGKVVGALPFSDNVCIGLESGQIGVLHKEKEANFSIINTLKGAKFHCQKYAPNLSCIKIDPVNSSKIATGGCENDLKIWDVNAANKRLVFAAKNVAHNNLDLRVPVWVSDFTFMQDQQTVAVVSRYKYVRLYDPRVKRQPVMNFKYEDSPITCVDAVPDRDHCIVMGTAHGRVTMFDLRKRIKNRAPVVFRKIDGAIKDVKCSSESSDTVFSVSLDRNFRVHDLSTKETVIKTYLGTKLTKILV